MDVPALIREVVQRAHDYGRQVGPDDKHSVVPKTDIEGPSSKYMLRSEHVKEMDDYKAANPQAGVIPTNGAHGGTGAVPSREQWTSGSYEDREGWKKQYGEDVADRIFA